MYYKMAQTENDFKAAKHLMKMEGEKPQELTFPTILAFDDENLVGFIATTPRRDMVLGGPMVIRHDKASPLVAARLAILYQKVLWASGIKWVIFYADELSSPFGRGMKRLFPHIKPYAKKGSVMFYNWPLDPKLQRSA
jgi:hypothetical protein